MNPDTPIDSRNFSAALYNSRDHFWNEEMVLEPATRKEHGGLTGLYYICVYGATSSNYKISAKNEDRSIMLKAGLSESGYVEHNEIEQLYYTDRILMDENVKVKFDGHVMVGSVRLRAKLCPRPDDISKYKTSCSFTLEEMLQEDPDEQVAQHVGSETESPDQNICSPNQFLEGSSRLRENNTAPCMYVLAVIGLSNYTSHYSVMVELGDESGRNHPVVLSEGLPSVAALEPNAPRYYMISIDDPDIVKLTVQLTTIHGDPDFYMSTTTKTPSELNFERRSVNSGLYPDLVVYERADGFNLTASYYIQVNSW